MMYMYFIYKKMYSLLHGLPVQSFIIRKQTPSCFEQYNQPFIPTDLQDCEIALKCCHSLWMIALWKKWSTWKKGNQISCVCVEEGHKYSPILKERKKISWLLKHTGEKCQQGICWVHNFLECPCQINYFQPSEKQKATKPKGLRPLKHEETPMNSFCLFEMIWSVCILTPSTSNLLSPNHWICLLHKYVGREMTTKTGYCILKK